MIPELLIKGTTIVAKTATGLIVRHVLRQKTEVKSPAQQPEMDMAHLQNNEALIKLALQNVNNIMPMVESYTDMRIRHYERTHPIEFEIHPVSLKKVSQKVVQQEETLSIFETQSLNALKVKGA